MLSPHNAEELQGTIGGGWIPEMAVLLGKEGEVTQIDQIGAPTIFGFKWSPKLVTKTPTVGGRVRHTRVTSLLINNNRFALLATQAITIRDQCNVCDQIYRNSLVMPSQRRTATLLSLACV